VRARVAAAALLALATVPRCGGSDGGPSTIVLLTIDTLRRDRVGCYGARTAATATPRLDALAARGARFHDARTPVPLTLPAHVTMLTGLPPAAHGIRSNSASRVPARAERSFSLLSEEMAAAGRRCGAFVSAQPLSRRTGLDAGFEAFDDGDLEDATRPTYAERPGAETVERARTWLAGLGQGAKAFLWVHLFEPHDPHPAGGYDADVAAADREAGALLDALEALGRADAVVLVVADHGEALGEQGEPTHGLLLGEGVLRVPFLLVAPGAAPGEVRRDPVDLADVAPTLLRLAGRAAPSLPAVPGAGIDLLARRAPADRPRVAEALHGQHQYRWAQLSAAVVGEWKLEDRGEGRERLFRLSDGAPGQDGGVPAAGRAEAEAPADALRRYRQGEAGRTDAGGPAPIGYGAGGAVAPFLSPAENAKRPDPYAVIDDAKAVSDVEAWVGKGDPGRLLERVGTIEARDPGNPYLPFLRGRLEAARRPTPDFEKAAEAFDRALALGRLDGDTVGLAAIARAERRDLRGGIAVLAAHEDRVRYDAKVYVLWAQWCGELGDAKGRDAACEKARKAARTPRQRAKVEAACGK
jgi:arylsulfatase A-like enzyme